MISNSKSVENSLTRFDAALEMVQNERTKTGAMEKRPDTLIKANEQYEENMVSA